MMFKYLNRDSFCWLVCPNLTLKPKIFRDVMQDSATEKKVKNKRHFGAVPFHWIKIFVLCTKISIFQISPIYY